jgi:RecA/RadA recombinase
VAIDEIEHLFDNRHPMATLSPDVTAALATLRSRWGAAAPRPAVRTPGRGDVGEIVGALATAPLPSEVAEERPLPDPPPAGGIVSTGFPTLDAILGPGGLPRTASVALRGTGSSGKTTLALRTVAEAQAAGSIAAWLDVGRTFDPVEAVARGVRLEWLVVVTPDSLDEGLSIAATLLAGRAVDLLVLDLPARLERSARPAHLGDRLHRLAALGRRSEALLVLLEPPGLPTGLAGAVAESAGLRLELARRSWIRLGRDVVGQRTEAVVARNRFGPPGRRAELRILYADGDDRDACLRRDDLLVEALTNAPKPPVPGKSDDATAPPLLASSPARPGAIPPRSEAAGGRPVLRVVPARARRPRRPAVDGRDGDRRRSVGEGPGGPAGDATGKRPPARA